LALLVIDIDHFKEFNDRFGHAAGDEILKRIVLDVIATARMSDFTYRFGGEEFVVIADGLSIDDAWALGERIRRRVAAGGSETEGRLTVSIGIAHCPRDGRNYETLFDAADRRLYGAKATGRNRVVGGEKGVRLVHSG
jgi:diguanylate cyclase (GGDEF)-like protein